jgi:transposase
MQKSHSMYKIYLIQRRNQLIEMVTKNGKGLPQAAKRLNIKLSTAKHIIKTFVEKGYLYNKKMHRVESTANASSQENSSPKNIS